MGRVEVPELDASTGVEREGQSVGPAASTTSYERHLAEVDRIAELRAGLDVVEAQRLVLAAAHRDQPSPRRVESQDQSTGSPLYAGERQPGRLQRLGVELEQLTVGGAGDDDATRDGDVP